MVLAACTGACAAGVACAMCWPAGRYVQSVPSYVPPPPTPYPSEQVTAMYVPPSYAPSAPIYPPTGVTATVPVHFGGPRMYTLINISGIILKKGGRKDRNQINN